MITCPKCGYTRKPEDQAPASECPNCGVIYAKAQPTPRPRRVEPSASLTPAPPTNATPTQPPAVPAPMPSKPAPSPAAKIAKACPECDGRISPRASLCPHCGEPLSPSKSIAVAVRDVEMPFNSMVMFMTKWAFASVPAILLISLIILAPLMLLGGLIKITGN